MSMLHPTEARQCKPCGNAWYAQAGYSSLKPGPVLFDAGQNAALAHSRAKYEQYRFCPRCGSDKVRTVRKKSFVPTAAQQPAPVVVNVHVAAPPIAPTAPPGFLAPPDPWHPVPHIPQQRVAEGPGSFVPSFALPTSDVLRSKLHPPVRKSALDLGDHVHTSTCLDAGCPLIDQPVTEASFTRYLAFAAWLLVALAVWCVQYAVTVPLGCLGAVAHTSKTRAFGIFAIVFCGLGWVYSLICVATPSVPRDVVRPWGFAKSN